MLLSAPQLIIRTLPSLARKVTIKCLKQTQGGYIIKHCGTLWNCQAKPCILLQICSSPQKQNVISHKNLNSLYTVQWDYALISNARKLVKIGLDQAQDLLLCSWAGLQSFIIGYCVVCHLQTENLTGQSLSIETFDGIVLGVLKIQMSAITWNQQEECQQHNINVVFKKNRAAFEGRLLAGRLLALFKTLSLGQEIRGHFQHDNNKCFNLPSTETSCNKRFTQTPSPLHVIRKKKKNAKAQLWATKLSLAVGLSLHCKGKLFTLSGIIKGDILTQSSALPSSKTSPSAPPSSLGS